VRLSHFLGLWKLLQEQGQECVPAVAGFARRTIEGGCPHMFYLGIARVRRLDEKGLWEKLSRGGRGWDLWK
jgi:hypothetical protein